MKSAIRQELERMGPKRVRRGMIAFEHRAEHGFLDGPCGGCCFLSHAYEVTYGKEYAVIREALSGDPHVGGHVERHFERHVIGWPVRDTRADLYAECLAFLAEHGETVEPAVHPDHQEVAR